MASERAHLTPGLVLTPGAPLIPILFLSQTLNAVLLLVLLPFIRSLGRNRELTGEHALGRDGRLANRRCPGSDRDLGAGARGADRGWLSHSRSYGVESDPALTAG